MGTVGRADVPSAADPKATSYRSVIALPSLSALTALAASYAVTGSTLTPLAAEWFVGFSMVVRALATG